MEQVSFPITAYIPESFWVDYARESREIENVTYTPEAAEYLRAFVEGLVSIDTLKDYVFSEAGAKIRDEPWMNVRVSGHVPLAGGPAVVDGLQEIIDSILIDSPYETHCKFLHLHPFLDGNGQAARAILAWQAVRNPVWTRQILSYPVLRAIYYMGLDHADTQIERGTFMVS